MLPVLLIALTLAYADAQGLSYCVDCGTDCRPPRNMEVAALNWETHTEEDPDNPGSMRSCVCNCGKRESEACVRGECGYGLRCLHYKNTDIGGGNICKPLCRDPGVYHKKMYTSCEEDYNNDVPVVIPRTFTCSDYEMPVSAIRTLPDGHHSLMNFINPCEMSNANAELVDVHDGGSVWKMAATD